MITGSRVLPGALVLLFLARPDAPDRPADHNAASKQVSAPICYSNQLLVLSSEDGVAAVLLAKETPVGVGYKFRFLPGPGKKEISGEGLLFEKYRRVPGTMPDDSFVIDEGGHLRITAGQISVRWSRCDQHWGWVYYKPESIRVQIANAEDFRTLDLRRFMEGRRR